MKIYLIYQYLFIIQLSFIHYHYFIFLGIIILYYDRKLRQARRQIETNNMSTIRLTEGYIKVLTFLQFVWGYRNEQGPIIAGCPEDKHQRYESGFMC